MGQLGSGQFANVEKAVWSRPHGIIEVAVKTLHNDASPADKLKFLQEGAMTSQFRHPNVIFLHGIIADKTKVSQHTLASEGIHRPSHSMTGLTSHGIHVKRRLEGMLAGNANRVRAIGLPHTVPNSQDLGLCDTQ